MEKLSKKSEKSSNGLVELDRGKPLDTHPLVSILIPIYNQEPFVEHCLNSVKNINYQEIEVLVCDDGSSDGSLRAIKEWFQINSFTSYKIITQKNNGLCFTLNKLISLSKGDYIYILAGDDVLMPNGISVLLSHLQNYPDLEACSGDAELIDERSMRIHESAVAKLFGINPDSARNRARDYIFYRWFLVGSTTLFRRTAYEIHGFYDTSLLVEDRDFALRLVRYQAISFINNTVAKYRIHRTNYVRRPMERSLTLYKQFALANVKHKENFSGLRRLYLSTFQLDLRLLRTRSKLIALTAVKIICGLRNVLTLLAVR